METFIPIYKTRPIKKNYHGMMFPHMFATFFILRKLKPELVIESGVYKGQSTWLIEAALPECKILCLDIDLKQIIYKSKSLKGVMEPFSTQGNLDLLKRAGFKDIVSIMKFVCFEGWLAIK